jgi:prophage antirepressor-like protein
MNYLSEKFPGLAPIFNAMDEADKMIDPGEKDVVSNDTLYQFTAFMFEDISVREAEINGVVWWVAKDACDALEIKQPTRAVETFPASEKGVILIHTPGGPQKMLCVNEAGLYRLVFRARKQRAEAFKTWVFEKVLPQIRKTGGHIPEGMVLVPEAALKSMNEAMSALQKLQAEITAGIAGINTFIAESMPRVKLLGSEKDRLWETSRLYREVESLRKQIALKNTPLGAHEKMTIQALAGKWPVAKIAEHTGRSETVIRRVIRNAKGGGL